VKIQRKWNGRPGVSNSSSSGPIQVGNARGWSMGQGRSTGVRLAQKVCHWQYTFRHFFIALDFSMDRTSCWNSANFGSLSTSGARTEGVLPGTGVSLGMGKESAVGRRAVLLLGQKKPISISLFLPCLIAGRRLGNIRLLYLGGRRKSMRQRKTKSMCQGK